MDLDSDDPWGFHPNGHGDGGGEPPPIGLDPDDDGPGDDPEIDDMQRLRIDYGNDTGADVVPDRDGDPDGLGCMRGIGVALVFYAVLVVLGAVLNAALRGG